MSTPATPQQWREVLTSLSAFPDNQLPQPRTVIVSTLRDTSPMKLLGLKHGVVFTPSAVLELLELAREVKSYSPFDDPPEHHESFA